MGPLGALRTGIKIRKRSQLRSAYDSFLGQVFFFGVCLEVLERIGEGIMAIEINFKQENCVDIDNSRDQTTALIT